MNQSIEAYLFDGFLVDVGLRTVTFRDHPVHITRKAYLTLLVLLRAHGKVVEKETILKEVWPDSFVEESTLAQNILTLRKVFAKFNKGKELIVTVPRRGYRFIGEVEEIPEGESVPVTEPESEKAPLGRDGLVRWKNRATRSVKLSPDGTKLACCLWDSKMNRMIIALVSVETGKVLDYPLTPRNDDIPFLDWSDNGADLYAVLRRAQPVSLWRISCSGGPPVQLGEWGDVLNLRLAISKDGQLMYYEVGTN